MTLSLILLAGGVGSRMKSGVPKQFLSLGGKSLALRSIEIFSQIPEITELVVVCAPEYEEVFSSYPITFAPPGKRRQDSLFNGLQKAKGEWLCIHDAARPLITEEAVGRLIEEGRETGAATLAVPVKATIKSSTKEQLVEKTLDRSQLWEIQTPQFLSRPLLEAGCAQATRHSLTVTDDVSLAELVGARVKLVMGEYTNLKVTTPEDLLIAEQFLHAQV